LINIIRVLYKKLTAPNTNANGSTQYKKAVRATLILGISLTKAQFWKWSSNRISNL